MGNSVFQTENKEDWCGILERHCHRFLLWVFFLKFLGADFEYISTDWLRGWLNPESKIIPPIDNTPLMCEHSRVNPYKPMQMKCVSSKAADILFDMYGGLPRFKSDSLCPKCSELMKRKERFEAKLAADMKIISKALKNNK